MTQTVTTYRGIRYAHAERFAPPRPVAFAGVPEPGGRSVAAPQGPSRIALVMGTPAPVEQSEDCLEVTVFAPPAEPGRTLPVLVWLHGGAYLTGSGGWNLYDATDLAATGPMVVVSVNYRLGLLGYASSPGLAPGNLGLADQIAALAWVQANVGAFGGDPSRVTLAGQSAGAQSIIAMLGIESTRGLFHRAIVQSAPLGLGFHSARDAARAAEAIAGDGRTDLGTCAVEEILATQQRSAIALAGPGMLRATPPFQPVWGVDPLPDPASWDRALAARIREVELMIGSTADEAATFLADPHPVYSRVRRLPLVGTRALDRLQRVMTERVFTRGAADLADRWSRAGGRAHLFRVGALDAANPFGACHCIELPLLFGDDAGWRDAPMLRGTPPARLAEKRASLRSRWAGFVTDGDPDWDVHVAGRAPYEL
ncbi:carboxylesterase family protein [Nocardioides sp. BYT-33-1]|uniref:carboxylesterase family protein n=1 Tax=Nocardioides sp. BYT-33-1 TaxID=3416952 RepID=UPI003F539F78